ncbi:MAG: hypothetical protein QOF44_1423 [Streptomyces sp.]|nr:hypothetical protein [Streptomyces sp.]
MRSRPRSRSVRSASVALIAMAALGLSVSPAVSAVSPSGNSNITSFGYAVSPDTVRAGGLVKLSSSGCDVPSVTASSGVFDTVQLVEGHPKLIRVDSDAKVGARYTVNFTCNGESGHTTLTIAGGTRASAFPSAAPTAFPSADPSQTPGTTPAPTAAIQGGFGGSVGGLNTPEALIGGALLVTAAAGGLLLVRRRRNGDHA